MVPQAAAWTAAGQAIARAKAPAETPHRALLRIISPANRSSRRPGLSLGDRNSHLQSREGTPDRGNAWRAGPSSWPARSARLAARLAGDARGTRGELGRAEPAGAGRDARRQAGGDRGGVAARLAAGAGRGRPRPGGRPGAAAALRRRRRAVAVDHRQRRRRLRQRGGDRVLRPGARHALDGGADLLAGRRGPSGRRVPLAVYPASGPQPESFPGAAVASPANATTSRR